jgi:hypothetical protein
MAQARMKKISIMGAFGIALIFSQGRAFSQTRPGINAFVKAPEGCSYIDPLDPNDLYVFTKTQIQALSLARAGELGTLNKKNPGKPSTSTPDRFATLREERIGDTCAGFIISPYTKSRNPQAAAVAKRLVAAYGELQKMTDEKFGLAIQQDTQTHIGPPVKTRLAELDKRRRSVLREMNNVLTTYLKLLVDESQTDAEGKPGRNILTHEQRISLRDFIQSQFPSLLVSDRLGTEPSDELTRQAAQIRSFLAGGTTPSARQDH